MPLTASQAATLAKEPLDEKAQAEVATLVEMGVDACTARQYMVVLGDLGVAVDCLSDESKFEKKCAEYLASARSRQTQNNNRGLRSQGSHAAAASWSGALVSKVPADLAGNPMQGASSGMAIVRDVLEPKSKKAKVVVPAAAAPSPAPAPSPATGREPSPVSAPPAAAPARGRARSPAPAPPRARPAAATSSRAPSVAPRPPESTVEERVEVKKSELLQLLKALPLSDREGVKRSPRLRAGAKAVLDILYAMGGDTRAQQVLEHVFAKDADLWPPSTAPAATDPPSPLEAEESLEAAAGMDAGMDAGEYTSAPRPTLQSEEGESDAEAEEEGVGAAVGAADGRPVPGALPPFPSSVPVVAPFASSPSPSSSKAIADTDHHRLPSGSGSSGHGHAASWDPLQDFPVQFKYYTGKSRTVRVHNEMTVEQVKAFVMPSGQDPATTRLIFAGKALDGGQLLGHYGLGKDATIHVLLVKGHAAAKEKARPDEEEDDEEDGDEDEDEPEARRGTELTLRRRCDPQGIPFEDFDGADGWATVEGIDVAPLQQWLLDRDARHDLQWIPYGGNGNELQYFLDTSHEYAPAMAQHLKQWFGPEDPKAGKTFEGFEQPERWEPVPECLQAAVAQLRRVLVCPDTGERLLDEFELGFAQFTRMPCCKITASKHPSGLAPPSAAQGRNLGAHWDSPGYLEAIITIGIFGTGDIQLIYPPQNLKRRILPRERKEGTTIGPGAAYALWASSRWAMYHDAIVGRNEQPIEGLRGETARVAATLRFSKRAFCKVFAREHGLTARPEPVLRATDVTCGETIVDAMYYDMSGRRRDARAYPHTYPALVLQVPHGDHLLVLYVSDGLIPDNDDEAWSFGMVPIRKAVLASDTVVRRCTSGGTRASNMLGRLMIDIRTGEFTQQAWRSVGDFAKAVRERGDEAVLRLLKASPVVNG